jgi:hypothetical protein
MNGERGWARLEEKREKIGKITADAGIAGCP